jgi:RNA polymerase sigma-70 factor (ECF subfamily)
MVLCAGNQDETEEITAEAFFRAWEKRRQFSGTQPAAFGWLITVARNILIDRRRSEGKHPVETFVDEELTDQGIDLEAILVDREQFQSTLAILQELPFPQGDIIALRYVLGWQIKAIAEHLGMAENTVSV